MRVRGMGATGMSALCAALGAQVMVPARAAAQACTTQAKMTAAQRTEIGTAAYGLASAVLAGDTARVRANTVAQYAADFTQSGYLIQATAGRIAGDTLQVTQAYLLDNSGRPAGNAEFTCALAGTTTETDFAIPGLPQGKFAFAMVEARGASPWLLSFLLEQEGGAWKMAGFYPHERTAAGHDGVWYWTTARADAKGDKPWLAWLMYGEADQLLRPAPFATSGNRDKLLGEQRQAAPEPVSLLSNGMSAQTPLTLNGKNGAVYQVTSLAATSGDADKTLNLTMHLQGQSGLAGEAAVARNVAAATALLQAHAELRQGFSNVLVIADLPGTNPVVTEKPMSEIVTDAR